VRPLRFAVFLPFLLAFVALACGPSFQAVYECDVHFEHCYALDESPAPPDSKQECWRGWLRGYTYGQSRDRVEYAATRFSQLQLGPTLPSEELHDARPRRHAANVGAPVPTSAFAPPPNLAAAVTPDASTPPPIRAEVRAPGADCSEGCSHRWTTCRDECKENERTCFECDRAYRVCVPSCFHDATGGPRSSL
jgi:hypothetical protein